MPTTPARQRLRDLLDSRELIVAPGVFDGISAQLARRTDRANPLVSVVRTVRSLLAAPADKPLPLPTLTDYPYRS